VEANVAYVKETAALGAKAFFTCVVASDASKGWKANYKLAVESFGPIVQACADTGGAIAIEGWPGGYPFYSNLCCTPETVRAFIRDLGPKGVGLNYDPSHLIRLGVDHVRFLREFAPYVHHVHGKDAETDKEWLYELGYHYHSIEKPGHGFGEWTWRYTVPGHGEARWSEIFRILKESGYAGKVSIELEDEQFNGSTEGEQAGLAHSLNFLQGA
jgi:sugar phosphate isomerase/epimerase